MMSLKALVFASPVCLILLVVCSHCVAVAQDLNVVRIEKLERDMARLQTDLRRSERQIRELDSRSRRDAVNRSDGASALVLFLCAAFCALWAQNTGRSAWIWFFLGFLFSVIAVLVLLAKNAGEKRILRESCQPSVG